MKTALITMMLIFCSVAQAQETVVGPTKIVGPSTLPLASAAPTFTPGTTAIGGSCNTGGTGCSLTSMSVTAGQFAIVCMAVNGTTAETYTLTNNNSDPAPTQIPGFPYVGTAVGGTCFYQKIQTTNGSYVLTCGDSSSIPFMSCLAAVYTGTPTSGWDLTLAANSQNATACPYAVSTGTSGTTANASELGISLFIAQSAGLVFTGTGSWTVRQTMSTGSGITMSIADNILSSTQTLTGTATLSGCGSVPSGAFVSSIK